MEKNTAVEPVSTRTEIMPRRTGLVPHRTRPPMPPRRPPVHRAWLRALLIPPPLHSYLAPDELLIICTRRHWLAPLRAAFRASSMMLGIAGLVIAVPALPLFIQLVLALATVGHTGWVTWCLLKWRVEQIAVTDRQLVRVHGILTTTADAVPLHQITDATLEAHDPRTNPELRHTHRRDGRLTNRAALHFRAVPPSRLPSAALI